MSTPRKVPIIKESFNDEERKLRREANDKRRAEAEAKKQVAAEEEFK